MSFIRRVGEEGTAFFSLTFDPPTKDADLAFSRWHSIATNVLPSRYSEWLRVFGRMESGIIHFHVLLSTPGDILTGTLAYERRIVLANENLRGEWGFWNGLPHSYCVGRFTLEPIWEAEAVANYFANHLMKRWPTDKHRRFVEGSQRERCNWQLECFQKGLRTKTKGL